MPEPRKPTLRAVKSPLDFLHTARACYGPAFGASRPRAIERARDDWADLAEEDRAFALAHLLYLNLMAQAASIRLQTQIRGLLDEIADSLGGEEPEDGDEPEADEAEADEPALAPAPEDLADAVGADPAEVGEVEDDGQDQDEEEDDGSGDEPPEADDDGELADEDDGGAA